MGSTGKVGMGRSGCWNVLVWSVLGAWLVLGGSASQTSESLPVLYMENHCRRHYQQYLLDRTYVDVGDSMLVELTADPISAGSMECIVTFQVKAPYDRVLIHFESVDINYNPGTVDRLRLYDGFDDRLELSPSRGLYGKYSKGEYQFSSGNIDKDYTSSGKAVTLYFVGTPSAAFGGFRALLTAVKDPIAGDCPSGYVHCLISGHCIGSALQCNGYQNCGSGDTTDQEDCTTPSSADDTTSRGLGYTADLGLMVGCAVSIVILMVVVLWLGIVCLKKTRLASMRQRMNDGGTVDTVDGAVVEPSQIRRVMSPPVSFLEPPPLYSEEPVQSYGPPPLCRFELPPPYSVDERDTAGLLLNETSADSSQPEYSIASQPHARVHGRSIQLNRVLPRRPYCPGQVAIGGALAYPEPQPPQGRAVPHDVNMHVCVRHPAEPASTGVQPSIQDPNKMLANIPECSDTSPNPVQPVHPAVQDPEQLPAVDVLTGNTDSVSLVTVGRDTESMQTDHAHLDINLAGKEDNNKDSNKEDPTS